MEHPNEVTVLPEATREEQLERWGLSPSHRWGEAGRTPHHADDAADHGDDDTDDDTAAADFLASGGWIPVDITRGRVGLGMSHLEGGARDAGMTSHRGVLHPDEHVDAEALRTAVEAELGFTYDEVRSVYRQGRITPAQLELRARIDARLLELHESGGNLLELARAFGWAIEPAKTSGGARCKTMERALERARNPEGSK